MKSDLPISVVIVNFNSGGYLRRCIASLQRSDVRLEIVVVDNASKDRSLEQMDTLPETVHQLKTVRNSTNLGFSSAVNIGARTSEGSYLLVLNPDCEVHPHTVSGLAAVLDQHPSAGLAGSLIFNEDGTEQRGCRRNDPTIFRSVVKTVGLGRWVESVDMTGQPLPSGPVEVDAISGAAMLFRRQVFDEIGGMDERYFLHCEDLDVCRRIRKAGFQVLFVPGISLFHRQGGSSGVGVNGIEKLKHQGMMRYYVEHLASDSITGKTLARLLVWGHYGLTLLKKRLQRSGTVKNAQGQDGPPAEMPIADAKRRENRIVISGANSDVGDFLLQHFKLTGSSVIALYRDRPGTVRGNNILWMALSYFENAPVTDLPAFSTWINVAPVWTVDRFVRVFRGGFPGKVVALSSTSIEAKRNSSDSMEQQTVEHLVKGEQKLEELCREHGAGFVVLRPTLIYGGPRNRNINLVKSLIRRCGFFPLPGPGEGLRQPVHAGDVATACMQVIDRSPDKRIYNIGGGEVLNYRSMIERVFVSLGRKPRFVSLPSGILKAGFRLLGRVPGLRGLSPELLDRMERDQVVSNEEATRDFGYAPGSFKP